MVGAEEIAGLDPLVGGVAAVLLARFGGQQIEQAELGRSGNREVASGAVDAAAIGVEHAGGQAKRIKRVGDVIFGAEQPLFLGRDEQEHEAAPGPRGAGELTRLFEHVGSAGRVVERAIVNPVAVGVGQADAEVVVVRGVDHRLVGAAFAREKADHIVAGDGLRPGGGGRGERGLQIDGLKVAAAGGGLGSVEVEPGVGEQLARGRSGHPAFESGVRSGRVGADDVEHGVGVGILDGVPAVGGGGVFVDDHHARRTALRGLFVFVGPAAVIGHRLAVEIGTAVGDRSLEVGIVDQHDEDFAAHVLVLEIVPLAFGRGHAVTGEDQRGVGEPELARAVERRAKRDVGALHEAGGPARALNGDDRIARQGRLKQGNPLRPLTTAIDQFATRLDPGRFQLGDKIGDGLGLARGCRTAPFIGVRSERLDMRGKPLGAELLGRGRNGGACGKKQQECERTDHRAGSTRIGKSVPVMRRPGEREKGVSAATGAKKPAGRRAGRADLMVGGSVLAALACRDGDPDGFAAATREAGKHRFDQVWNQRAQLVGRRTGDSLALEQRLVGRTVADVHFEVRAIFGVHPDLIVAEPGRVVPAVVEGRGEAAVAIAVAAEIGTPAVDTPIGIEPAAVAEPIAVIATIEGIVEA